MKPTANPRHNRGRAIAVCMVILVCLGATAGCGGPVAPASTESVAQAVSCGWSVWRYDAFNKVWASITSLLQLDYLNDGAIRAMKCDGYVAADSTGQGCLSKTPGCSLVWVWQKSKWAFGAEAITACAKGSTSAGCSASATATVKNCAVKIVTKPASISVKSTVTVADDQNAQLTLVIVHHGEAAVVPATAPDAEIALATGQAAYFVSREMPQDQLDATRKVFGFPPNQPVPLDQIVPPIEALGWTPQMRRANAVALGEGEIVPLPIPFAWSLRSLDEKLTQDAANQFASGWRSAVRWEERQDTPIAYEAWLEQGNPFIRQLAGPNVDVPDGADYGDLREIPANPGVDPLRDALMKAGYDPAKQLVLLVAEDSVESLGPMADWIVGQLNDSGLPAITKAVNSESLEAVTSELQAVKNPAFLLTWY